MFIPFQMIFWENLHLSLSETSWGLKQVGHRPQAGQATSPIPCMSINGIRAPPFPPTVPAKDWQETSASEVRHGGLSCLTLFMQHALHWHSLNSPGREQHMQAVADPRTPTLSSCTLSPLFLRCNKYARNILKFCTTNKRLRHTDMEVAVLSLFQFTFFFEPSFFSKS